jgi:Type I phosphodiesterase / nucleotide pyrophosphatase
MTRIRRIAVSLICCMASIGVTSLYGNDGSEGGNKIRRVLVISIDGLHSLDFALWVKNNPTSTIAQLAAQGINFSNASTTKPSDSIPSTTGIFTGGTPAVTGMWYDDAYNRAWFAPTNTTCTGAPGTTFSLKGDIDVDPQPTVPTATNETVDPTKVPRQLVNGVCTPVLPHNMMRVNTVFEVVRSAHGLTAYTDKTASYDFLNGPSGAGIVDLYTPEIGTTILKDIGMTEAFDDLRLTSILNEIKGMDHTGTKKVGVPMLFGMNFQAINAAKKDSLGGGYADDFGTPNASLQGALQHTDASLGQIVTALQQQNLKNSTAIIFTAKHGESALDPSERFVELTSAIQAVLTPAGFPVTVIPKITEKTTALIWLKNQSQTAAVAAVLSLPANEQSLHIQQILTGDSLKLLFGDPLVDPSTPDIIVVPSNGTNYEPSASTALPAVQAEHGGFNENETHVPLLVVHPYLTPGQNRAPVTTTQIAPTILSLLGLNPNSLKAVQLEGTTVLPGTSRNNNGDGNDN